MDVKTDTKEKFTVITPIVSNISANMTEELADLLLPYLDRAIPHVILNMKNVATADVEAGGKLAELQQQFYEKNSSFVLCELHPDVKNMLEQSELADCLNTTPTESEAWDIVQMEEIEREMMNDFDEPGES
ncbi:MAG: STAS domain-containing protein [Bacteroidetes bacterium]|nr:STAS domain-containing protein [Bacteroidota bacterium]